MIKLPAELQEEISKSAQRMRWLNYLTRNVRPPSKHAAGHAGQKAKAKARRRGKHRRSNVGRLAEIAQRSMYANRPQIVVAGNYKQFLDYCHRYGFSPRDRSRVIYATKTGLRGLSGDFKVVYIGTWVDNRDLKHIERDIAVIQATSNQGEM